MALATLSVDFVARLAEFRRGLDEAGRLSEARARQIGDSFGRLKTLGAGIAAGFTAAFAAGGAAVAFAQRINAPLLAMKDLSEATGATIENISALENVARNAGTSLDVAGGALIRLNQQLGQTNGRDRTSEALRRIGLDAQELKKLDPAMALREVAKALAQYADDGEKARLVQELFGKSVREAGPFLKELADQQQFAATVTAKQVQEADKLNKEIARFNKYIEDAQRAIVARFVPALNRMFDAARQGTLLETIGNTFRADFIRARLQATTEEIERLRSGAERAQRVLERQPDSIYAKSTLAEFQRLQRAAADYRVELLELANASGGRRPANEGGGGFRLPGIKPREEEEKKKPVVPGGFREGAAFGPDLERLRQSVLDLTSQTTSARLDALREQLAETVFLKVQTGDERYDETLRLIRDQIVALDPEAQAATARIERINAALAATPSAQMRQAKQAADELFDELSRATDPQQVRELNEALEQLWTRLGLLPEAAEKVGESMSVFAEQASRNIQDALGDTLERVLQGNFKNIGQLWLQTLQRMAAQAAAAKLNQFLFGPGGAGGGNALLAGLANIFKPRADGGPAQPGESYLVGERGPELITMGSIGGYVTRAERLRTRSGGGSGGGGYAPTINIMGDVGPATVALVERAIARERARWQRMQYAGGMA